MTTYSCNKKFSPSIRAAVQLAKKTLDRYYQLTDSSEVYRIAMVLHPHHKLFYFKSAGWEDDWINTAEALVRDEFERSYLDMEIEDDDVGMAVDLPAKPAVGASCSNIFDSMPALAPSKSTDLGNELDRYLSADVENITANAIAWWHERHASYPHLSRMAMDYLTIPATSVDVEHLFSHGRLLLTHVHSCLSAESTHALLCLSAWSHLNLVKTEDVLKVATLPDVQGDAEVELEDGWDRINVN
ncbi:hypothetical protein AZE42_13159 [Rhizopogon vesiculosus]|uniref:HAT C-terminal dimerisation domain-containing protein n=1 Tax=Rhizopogon vesiculosus TaxID=180088 RepID=A0A1J8PUT5_9AGAM|nr:hypothetical protein AZE42_13159 [Rhizopogon vesiculosus]